jgi:threonine/homoserine/homoserine lactone efflux protein
MPDPISLAVGFVAGLVGAMPPGPLSVALMHRGANGDRGAWLFAGLGGAVTHLIFLIAIGLGTTPVLLTLAERNVVRLVLALGVIAWAVAFVARSSMRARETVADPANGAAALHGATAMESQVTGFGMLAAKWIVVLGFALANGPLVLGTIPLVLFAAGVWTGALAWFSLLPRLGARATAAGIPSLGRVVSYVAAAVMLASGLAGLLRVLG